MKRPSFFHPRFFLFLFVAGVAGLAPAPVEAKAAKMLDLTDTVLSNRIMTKFALVIRGSGELATFLSSRGPFTLFAPTDSAFSKLPPGELDTLLRPENRTILQQILLYHIVNGNRYSAKALLAQKSLPSCDGPPLALHTSHTGAQFVQKAKILRADIRCENGILHEIDTVLIPPGLVLPTPVPPGTPAVAPSPATPTAAAAQTNSGNPPPAPAGDTTPETTTETNAAPVSTNVVTPPQQ